MIKLSVPITGEGAGVTTRRFAAKLACKPGDCGVDLFPRMLSSDDLQITELGYADIWSVPTGVHLAVPSGHFAWVTPRSSSFDRLLGCQVIPGIIDHGYTGEYRIRFLVPNHPGQSHHDLQLRDSIWSCSETNVALAQFIIIPFVRPDFFTAGELPKSERGDQGYGSTDNPNQYEKK
jgi:dUTP pyrophosphatase